MPQSSKQTNIHTNIHTYIQTNKQTKKARKKDHREQRNKQNKETNKAKKQAKQNKTKNIPARDPKQCCGVFLLEIVDAKSVSGSLHQNPVVPLLQDVFVRISASAASRATCARSLYAGLLSKTSLSGSLRQDPVVGPLVQDHCIRISCARCLCQNVCIRSL